VTARPSLPRNIADVRTFLVNLVNRTRPIAITYELRLDSAFGLKLHRVDSLNQTATLTVTSGVSTLMLL
jgi:hypothetical protein